MKPHEHEELYELLKNVFIEIAAVEPVEINPDAHLEDDLGIDKIVTYPRIIKTINERLEGGLPMNDRSFMAEIKECETVGELVDLIETESQF